MCIDNIPGHRNPQGLAWDDEGRLWATEHGSSASDEKAQGIESPVLQSGADTWAPSGIAYFEGSLFFRVKRPELI